MPGGSYRDELQAAHDRIAALEQELAEARGRGQSSSAIPEVLTEQLVDGETVLWHGRPDARRYVLDGPRRLWGALWGVLALAWLPLLLRGMRINVAIGAALVGGGAWLAWSGVRALRRARHIVYAITPSRILLASLGRTLTSIPLAEITKSSLRLRGGGCGDLHLEVAGSREVTLQCVPDASRVFRLLSEAQKALASSDSEEPKRLEEGHVGVPARDGP